MSHFHAFILGIVEGITEFLPISSTGHLILAGKLLGIGDGDFAKSFDIAIQLGAILSVVVLYWRSFLVKPEVLKRVMVAFLPTAVIGFALYKLIKKFLLGNTAVVLWAMVLGGIILIVFERFHREDDSAGDAIETLPYGKAALIGVVQALAVIPGVSRSAATIIGGLSMGLKRRTIVEFSFLLAVPTMLAATVLDLFKNASSFSSDQFGALLVGSSTAFVIALLSIRFLMGYIRKHSFAAFGVYRIAAAVVFWLFVR